MSPEEQPLTEAATVTAAPPPVAAYGPNVKHGDVMPYAKKRCGMCQGTGEYVLAPVGKGTRAAKLCGCAMQRFLKANKSRITFVPGEGEHKGDAAMHWRAP